MDREKIESYILTVRASDNGGKSTNATVNIQILDVNDQTPKFVDVEPFRVVEGQSGALVGKIEAKDNDIGENAIGKKHALKKYDQCQGRHLGRGSGCSSPHQKAMMPELKLKWGLIR